MSFRFPFTIEDQVPLALPEGYALESPRMPRSIGDVGAFNHSVTIGKMKDGRLAYLRNLSVVPVMVEAQFYDSVRTFFQALHLVDNHLLTLRVVETDPEEKAEETGE